MTELGRDADGLAKSESDHFMKCPGCGQWFDMRDLVEVAQHVHDGEFEVGEVHTVNAELSVNCNVTLPPTK